MKVLITGADGFLGWHTRVRLHADGSHDVLPVGRGNWSRLPELTAQADAIIHIAGVNRGEASEVEHGNAELAEDVAKALRTAPGVRQLIFANSIQAGADNPYGTGKHRAGSLLETACAETGASYVDVRLPNLFGEGGRPNYNSFVATFVHKVLAGDEPQVADRSIGLLHVQDAAQALIDALTVADSKVLEPTAVQTSVPEVHRTLITMRDLYRTGDVPPLTGPLDLDLFNTLRYAMFPEHYPIGLVTHSDQRGGLTETVRAHGGQGQTFVSTTRPGFTRGEHFHLRKVERFVVIAGRARIALRRVLSDEVINFDVDGSEPAIVDMPTMWAHNITNVGDDELVTLFWSHELFDPDAPDTHREPVAAPGNEREDRR